MSRLKKFLLGFGLTLLFILFGLPYLIPLPPQPDRDATDWVPAGGQLITVDGVRTVLMDVGPRDGSVVVLIHGFGGSTFSWRETLPALAEAGYRAIAFDLKGFGLSDKTFDADYTHAAQATFTAHLLDALGIERATLVGHSMGGSVVGHFAYLYPDRVERLVFVDGAVFTADRPTSWTRSLTPILIRIPPFRRWAQIAMRSLLNPERITASLRTAYSDPNFVSPEIAEKYLLPQTMKDWDLALLGIMRAGGQNALPTPLDFIQAPTLIVWGADDTWVPLEAGERLRDSVPQAEWAVFPNAGHLPMEEQASAFNTRLLEFLDARP
jgi:pimeloyl-ACP methyl ester carboxylesterase